MKIVFWNMGCAPIAFVQEALLHTDAITATDRALHWPDTGGTDSGTAIFIRNGKHFEPKPLESEGSYIAGVTIPIGEAPTLFVSLHVGLPNYRKHLKVLAETLGSLAAGQRLAGPERVPVRSHLR